MGEGVGGGEGGVQKMESGEAELQQGERECTAPHLVVHRNERMMRRERSRGALAVHQQLLHAAPDQVLFDLRA